MVQGRAAHNAGRRASFKAHFQIGTGIPLQDTNALASPFQKIPPELCVTSIGRTHFRRAYRVNKPKLGIIHGCEI